ncbi:hypothetical protein RAS12_24025 [Achromobacter seleniivolatilans]|uniref:Uncharacterized protein n=1 Tax=Achromobacter seleniivolatilans TaxID=3047478 RepID=A0ABY9LY01_9BURK|nr:hypothetical protein [Achromobacter sp. R39]WMD19658.1 hypothetical protein RAS12_24025 [Achromobacter sp. R39]
MTKHQIASKTVEQIKARLHLAQRILEDSDSLPGWSFNPNVDNFAHERHEREALTEYLLLTCFDKLGQHRDFMPFANWINSQKSQAKSERAAALESLRNQQDCCDPEAMTRVLLKRHSELYGVGAAFEAGIEHLPEVARAHLLDAIRVSKLPPEAKVNLNTSYPSKPIDDPKEEHRLKVRYLYSRRNSFTHNLAQFLGASTPMLSAWPLNGQTVTPETVAPGASWSVYVIDKSLAYGGTPSERRPYGEDELLNFTLRGWPFVLFEVLYYAIDIPFDRTSINLKFSVMATQGDQVDYLNSVAHSDLAHTVHERYGVHLPKGLRVPDHV